MSTHIDGEMTVRELVGRYPQTRLVFEKHGIDYCCGGVTRLADVAKKHDLRLPELVDALEKALETAPDKPETVDKDWYAEPLGDLVTHIVEIHHGYTKTALPRLRSLISAVLKAHEAEHGDMLRQVQDLFNSLDEELSVHLIKEEQVLFPYIMALDAHVREGAPMPQVGFGSARNPIGQMEHEHESAGHALAKIREVTCDYALPADACPTFAAMYKELQRMEADLHQHIHLENNILFPRTIKLDS